MGARGGVPEPVWQGGGLPELECAWARSQVPAAAAAASAAAAAAAAAGAAFVFGGSIEVEPSECEPYLWHRVSMSPTCGSIRV